MYGVSCRGFTPQVPEAMAYFVRRARIDDAPSISKLCQRVYKSIYYPLPPENELAVILEQDYGTNAVIRDLTDERKQEFVAVMQRVSTEDGNQQDRGREEILGMILLTRGTEFPPLATLPAKTEVKIELERIYIDVPAQRIGIGKLLMTHAEDVARGQGITMMWLYVWMQNEKAQEFYARMGYRKIGEWDFGDQRDCIFVKDL